MALLIDCESLPQLLRQPAVATQLDQARPALAVASPSSDRALVLDCSLQVATLSVQAGQSVWRIRRHCPALRVTTVLQEQIAAATALVLSLPRQHADLITLAAVCFWTLPLAALGAAFRVAPRIVRQIQRDLRAGTRLVCTVTLAPQRQVARTFSRALPSHLPRHSPLKKLSCGSFT